MSLNIKNQHIHQLIGKVTAELLKQGQSVEVQDIIYGLYSLSIRTSDLTTRELCQQAIHHMSAKLH